MRAFENYFVFIILTLRMILTASGNGELFCNDTQQNENLKTRKKL